MAKQSLFAACKRLFRDGISGTYTIGNTDIFLELYTQEDIDNGVEIGNSSEENIVVIAGETITIPSGYTLTPVKPKKSLVIICNTFVNNGTISMYKKAPNVLPHDLFIIPRQEFGGSRDVLVSAYANNGRLNDYLEAQGYTDSDFDGINGTNHQCGSGGLGQAWYITAGVVSSDKHVGYGTKTGSGYAFGGGAGSGGIVSPNKGAYFDNSVDSTYPMHGSNGMKQSSYYFASGGVGYPSGTSTSAGSYSQYVENGTGCGGRIIIFTTSFTNNGTINANGSNAIGLNGKSNAIGGASGGGAIDLFYTTLLKQGTITANGGQGGNYTNYNGNKKYVGAGGNGSVTYTTWGKSSVLKPIAKYMSRANMIYFLTNYIERLKQGED